MQRSFVVEYKSNRRQPKAGGRSIWGDTDLKALAKVVAHEMPLSKVTSNDDGNSEPDTARGGTIRKPEPHLHALIETNESTPAGSTIEASLKPANTIEPMSVPDRPSQLKRSRRTGSRANTAPSRPETSIAILPPGSTATLSDGDILTILDMENRRLKELLLERLRSENSQLKEMLQRFAP